MDFLETLTQSSSTGTTITVFRRDAQDEDAQLKRANNI
jgi:hypothetical protein